VRGLTVIVVDNTPTIRQLAALVGLSRTTVSLALRNHPCVTRGTRELIQRVADEQGYTIDPLVSTLMNRLRTPRRARTMEKLALLTTWDSRDGWRSGYNAQRCFEGMSERARKLGYEMEEFWAKEPGMNAARLSKILHTRGIRGVIIAPLPRSKGHFSLNWQYFASATISQSIVRPALHRCTHSHYQGMQLALRKLRQLGYKRIGFSNLLGHDERVNHGWLASYLVYQYTLPAKQRVQPFLVEKWNRREFEKWLIKNKPDIILSNMLTPMEFALELGIDLPGEIGYASLDRQDISPFTAGVDQQPRMCGAAAVDLIVLQLQNNEFGLPAYPKLLALEGIWREGKTVRKQGADRPLSTRN